MSCRKSSVHAWIMLLGIGLAATGCGSHSPLDPGVEEETPSPATTFVDEFEDGDIDSRYWEADASVGSRVEERDGRLVIEVDATSTGASFGASQALRCSTSGDLDVRVDFELLEWPRGGGVRAGLIVSSFTATRVDFVPGDFNSADSYVADHFGRVVTLQHSDVAGTLRVTRQGDLWTSYYLSGSEWIEITSTTRGVVDDMRILLALWSHDYAFGDQTVRVAFDNFRIETSEPIECD